MWEKFRALTLQEILEQGEVFALPFRYLNWRVVGKPPNRLWLKGRVCQQNALLELLQAHPNRLPIIKLMIELVVQDDINQRDQLFSVDRDLDRLWRLGKAELLKAIKQLVTKCACQDDLAPLLALVYLSMPELFRERMGSPSQAKLDEYYAQLGHGDYSFCSDIVKAIEAS